MLSACAGFPAASRPRAGGAPRRVPPRRRAPGLGPAIPAHYHDRTGTARHRLLIFSIDLVTDFGIARPLSHTRFFHTALPHPRGHAGPRPHRSPWAQSLPPCRRCCCHEKTRLTFPRTLRSRALAPVQTWRLAAAIRVACEVEVVLERVRAHPLFHPRACAGVGCGGSCAG